MTSCKIEKPEFCWQVSGKNLKYVTQRKFQQLLKEKTSIDVKAKKSFKLGFGYATLTSQHESDEFFQILNSDSDWTLKMTSDEVTEIKPKKRPLLDESEFSWIVSDKSLKHMTQAQFQEILIEKTDLVFEKCFKNFKHAYGVVVLKNQEDFDSFAKNLEKVYSVQRKCKKPKIGGLLDLTTFRPLKDTLELSDVVTPLQRYSRDEQTEMKTNLVRKTLISITEKLKREGPLLEPSFCRDLSQNDLCCPVEKLVIGYPLEGYRNKCEFTFGFSRKNEPCLGFVRHLREDKNFTVEFDENLIILTDYMREVVRKFNEKLTEFSVFRREEKIGCLRCLTIRDSGKERMLILQIFPSEERKKMENFLTQLKPDSAYLVENSGCTDNFENSQLQHLFGKTHISMEIANLSFDISPTAFFQVNLATCELLYSRCLEYLGTETERVVDVCCGVGTISSFLAKKNLKVIGIEMNEEAVKDARLNAEKNGLSQNLSFVSGRAEKEIHSVLPRGEFSCVVNPPRCGLHPSLLKALRNCARLKRLVYISCNPTSLTNDVKKLCQTSSGTPEFRPIRCTGVDMFPGTLHCETVLLLQR